MARLPGLLALVLVHLWSQQRPVFRSSAEYVAVNVVVTDRQGRMVTDLAKDDFEIVESKRPQTVAGFKFVSVLKPRGYIRKVSTIRPS